MSSWIECAYSNVERADSEELNTVSRNHYLKHWAIYDKSHFQRKCSCAFSF